MSFLLKTKLLKNIIILALIFRARQKTQINLTNPIESKRSGVNCLIDPNYPQKEKQQSDSLSLLQLRKTPTQFQSDKIFKFFDERFKQSIPATGIESFTISFNPLQSKLFPLEYYQSSIFEVKLESPLPWIAPQGYFNISMRNPQFGKELLGHKDLQEDLPMFLSTILKQVKSEPGVNVMITMAK